MDRDHLYDDIERNDEIERPASSSANPLVNFLCSFTRPASHCCLWVPLVRGVRLISFYTLATGFLYLPQVTRSSKESLPEQVQQWKTILSYTWSLVNVLGIVMGFQGLMGLKTRDARKLRQLFIYYLIKLILQIPTIAMNEVYVCTFLDAQHKEHPTEKVPECSKARASIRQMELADLLMIIIFAHAVWSMAKRLETMDLDGIDITGLEFDNHLGLPLMNNQAFTAPRERPGRPAAPTERPRVATQSVTPFSGQAFRLE